MRRGEKDPAASTLEAESRETPEPETGATPKSQLRGILNSIVVRSSENDGGSEFVDGEVGALDDRLGSPSDLRRRGSSSSIRRPVDPLSSHRLGSSPPRHRGSPPPFHRHESPSAFLRRHSPPTPNRRGSPSNFHHRSQRFKENPVPKLPGFIARSLVMKSRLNYVFHVLPNCFLENVIGHEVVPIKDASFGWKNPRNR